MKFLSLGLISLVSLAVLALMGCGDDPTPTPTADLDRPEYGGTLKIGRSIPRNIIDPYLPISNTSYLWPDYESLLGYKQPYDETTGPVVEPRLATEYSADAAGTTWTFKLRQDVKWHDGEAFNADDVVATFKRATEPDLPIARRSLPLKAVIKDVHKVDDYTVAIETDEPNATLIDLLANNHAAIMPAHLITGDPTSDDPAEKWVFLKRDTTGPVSVGTGPFKMTEWDPEGDVRFVRFDEYWGEDEFGNQLPYLDGFVAFFEQDDTRNKASFVARAIHTGEFSGMAKHEVEALCAQAVDPEVCFGAQHGHGWFSITLNTGLEVWQDPRIVKASRYSLQARNATEVVFGEGTGDTADIWIDRRQFPDATLTEEEQFELMPWTDPDQYDDYRQKAKDLLTEAGYPEGFELDFPWYSFCGFRNLYTPMVDSFVKSGIQGFQQCREGINLSEEIVAGRFAVVIDAAGVTYSFPEDSMLLSATSFAPNIIFGHFDWEGQDGVDEIYFDAIQTLDLDERYEGLKAMDRYMADPEFTVYAVGYNYMTQPIHGCVRNYFPGPGMYHGQTHLTTWLEEECR